MSKNSKEIIRLISSKTKHFYTFYKNKKLKNKKLKLKKFDPLINKHIIYEETKFKK